MITKYGVDNFLIIIAISVCLIVLSAIFLKGWLGYLILFAGILLGFFAFWFFRDPDRNIPQIAYENIKIILAPADGKIVEIKKLSEETYIGKNVTQISIFLSPLDVHVNRIPFTGKVVMFKYFPGDYLVAFHPKSSEKNEQTLICVENSSGSIIFKQIVGILARRLVWDIKEGDSVTIGQKFGMMKFGSRMDIILKSDSKIFVKQGDKVIAGETIIGELN